MVDIKGLKELREMIRKLPEEAFHWEVYVDHDDDLNFGDSEDLAHLLGDMKSVLNEGIAHCGTAGCVAGWAVIHRPKLLSVNAYGEVCSKKKPQLTGSEAFAEAYGLTHAQAVQIVYGYDRGYDHSREGAIECLDDLLRELEGESI